MPLLASIRVSLKARFTVADTTLKSGNTKLQLAATPYSAEVRSQLAAQQVVEPGALEELGKATVVDPSPVNWKKQGSALVPSEMKMDAK
jgi:hypothetical protein